MKKPQIWEFQQKEKKKSIVQQVPIFIYWEVKERKKEKGFEQYRQDGKFWGIKKIVSLTWH